jgi:hypothetical protein
MAWKIIEKGVRTASPFPLVTLGKATTYFNEACAERIGFDMEYCIVVEDEKLKKLGFWFFKNKPTLPDGLRLSNAYVVKKKDVDRGFRVAFKIYLKAPKLAVGLGRIASARQFLLEREPNDEFGKDFFVINLAGNSHKSGFQPSSEEK